MPNSDDALGAGLVWGTLAGCVFGGVIVGVICGRTGLWRNRWLTSLAAPGTLLSDPDAGVSKLLAGDFIHGLARVAVVLVLTSSLAGDPLPLQPPSSNT